MNKSSNSEENLVRMVAKGAGTKTHEERCLTQYGAIREFIAFQQTLRSNRSIGVNEYSLAPFITNGRRQRWVADLLISLEKNPANKVHALLAIGSYDDAAAVACRARDPDLIYTTMLSYEQGISNEEEVKSLSFSETTSQFLEVINMSTTFYSRLGGIHGGNIRPSTNILLRRQRHAEAGLEIAKKALAIRFASPLVNNEREKEKIKTCLLKEASNIFETGGKDCAFEKSCTDEHIALIADQKQMRRSYGSIEVAPPSSSLASTIMSILKYGAVDPHLAHRLRADADRIAKKYKLSEKQLWHFKVRGFSESGQWAILRNLADSRDKPPIGIKPFALAAIKGRRGHAEIMYYIDRMTEESDGEDRFDLFCEAGMWKKALEESVRLGDATKIAHVRSVCNSPDIQRICDEYTSSPTPTQTCISVESFVEQVAGTFYFFGINKNLRGAPSS